ncbi:hypothetical protein [uncultured Muriicola sp.]|uniref:hypothetical protein n=1 Tax=uncultured Muriicola sp. TaxID=1583102 RepID=UPI002618DA0D|nr:hypothetical protein [uncultured Muriicola sp.]
MRNILGFLSATALLLVSCGGGDDPAPEPPPPVVVVRPSAAVLVFPDNNTECNEGTVLNDNQSTVTFRWTDAENADSYELNLKNLANNSSTSTNANNNSIELTILRGTPYEWFVVSKATGTSSTATSPTWKFYNQGPGVENYAPFPAEAVSPARGATVAASGTITLEWTGSDVDNDLVEYEIFFGTDDTALSLIGSTIDNSLDTSINANTVYYWRVLSIDSQGNTSQSEIFEFRVQ